MWRDGQKPKGFARAASAKAVAGAGLFEINDLGTPQGLTKNPVVICLQSGTDWYGPAVSRRGPFAVVEWSMWWEFQSVLGRARA